MKHGQRKSNHLEVIFYMKILMSCSTWYSGTLLSTSCKKFENVNGTNYNSDSYLFQPLYFPSSAIQHLNFLHGSIFHRDEEPKARKCFWQ